MSLTDVIISERIIKLKFENNLRVIKTLLNRDPPNYDMILQELEFIEDEFMKDLEQEEAIPEFIDGYKEYPLYTALVVLTQSLFLGKGILERVHRWVYDKRPYSEIYPDVRTIIKICDCVNNGDSKGIKKYTKALELSQDLEAKIYETFIDK